MTRQKENFIALQTILIREVHRFFRTWIQTLLPPLITATLYFIIFGHLIGSRIGMISGINYMQFIAPGVIMMWVIMGAYNNVAGSFFLSKFQRNIEELLVSPVPNQLILLGYIGGGIARGFVTAILISIVTLFFTHLSIPHIFVTFISIFLSSLLFALAGFINGIYAKTFDDIMLVPTFILTPLTYLGGVFYSIKMLPPIWQKISLANPIFYMVDLFRYSILGISDINIWLALSILILCVLLLYSLCLYLLNKGIGVRT